jgi:predicted DNA-binding transcriptional regulator YafY
VATTRKKKPKGDHGRADAVEMMSRVKEVMSRASGHDQPTRQELAVEFKITPRSVANLISYMKKIGIQISAQPRPRDGKKGYVVNATDFLKQDLSVAEAVASVLLTQSVLGTPLAADTDATEGGVHRITASLGSAVRSKLDRLSGRFAVRLLRAAKPPRTDAFRVVLDAILENFVLNVEYESPYGVKKAGGAAASSAGASTKARRVETVQIEPFGVFFARRSWYVVARKRPSGDMRLYKLARFKRVSITDQTFVMPRGWNLDTYLKHAWETIHDAQSTPVKVVIDLTAAVAGNMMETLWHPSQHFQTLADGTVRFTATVAGFDELVWWVLGIGSNARVVEPAELRKRVHDEIRAMHRMVESES